MICASCGVPAWQWARGTADRRSMLRRSPGTGRYDQNFARTPKFTVRPKVWISLNSLRVPANDT